MSMAWIQQYYGVLALIIIAFILVVFFGWDYQPEIASPFGRVVPPAQSVRPVSNANNFKTATSSTDISDVFSQASSYNNRIDQMDFFKEYIGKQIYGVGIVAEVSRMGNDFLVDIKERNQQIVACSQNGGEEKERELLLLKGKNIGFTGVFTNHRIADVGLHGVTVDNCWLERK